MPTAVLKRYIHKQFAYATRSLCGAYLIFPRLKEKCLPGLCRALAGADAVLP
jgi:hypothetical protein